MEIIFNHKQYIDWKYNNKSLKEIKLERTLDKYIGHIKRNKKLYKQLVISLGFILFINSSTKVSAADLTQIDNLGRTFLSIVRKIGYWLALIMALVEIIKASMRSGGTSEIGKILCKYLLIYASMFLLPMAFDLVRSSF